MTDNVGIITSISQLKPDSPIEIISPMHTATPEQLAAFNAMTEPERQSFWKNVRLELLRYGIEFSNLSLDGNGVAFSDRLIAGPSLTSMEFFKRLMFVRSGARIYHDLLGNLHVPSTPAPQSLPLSQEATLQARAGDQDPSFPG